jgi:hypothetical protein
MSAPVSLEGGIVAAGQTPRTNRGWRKIPERKIFSPNLSAVPDRLQRAGGHAGRRASRKTSRRLQENRSMQMKRTLIRYKTRTETTEQNQRLIEDVFAELQAKSPEGIRYMALKLADGSFLHFVETGEGDSPLPAMEAFRRFQSGIRERCIEPPQPSEAIIVGNYRMLGER